MSSTERVAELGDLFWRELLEEHDEALRRALARYGRREVDRAKTVFLRPSLAQRALFDPHLRAFPGDWELFAATEAAG